MVGHQCDYQTYSLFSFLNLSGAIPVTGSGLPSGSGRIVQARVRKSIWTVAPPP